MSADEKIRILKIKARKLKNNRDQLPPEQLHTVFKKAYVQLKEETESLAREVMFDIIFEGINTRYLPDKYLEDINKTLSSGGYACFASEALYHADMKQFLKAADYARKVAQPVLDQCREETCGIMITPESMEIDGPPPLLYSPLTNECLTGYSWQGDQIVGGRWEKYAAPACG